MAAFVGKLVAKKLVSGKKSKQEVDQDAYFVKVPTKTMGMSHTKKQPKPFHADLTADEVRVLAKVRRRAYRLDMALFNIPGIGRFGWSSVIGLIPAIGDFLDSVLAFMLIRTCLSVEPPLPVKVKNNMYMNLIIDFFIGLVPLLGDIADAVYKCNTKNFLLLEKELEKRAKQRRDDSGLGPALAVDADVEEFYQPHGNQHIMNSSGVPPPRYASTKKPRRPEQAYNPERSEARGGYSGARRERDLEAGEGFPQPQPPRH